MNSTSRELFAHLARALSRYVPDAEREARQLGYSVPPELLTMAAFFTDCARTRPDATSSADGAPSPDSGPMSESLVLTKKEAGTDLRVSVRQVERLIASGALPAVKLGGAVRIRRADLDDYVNALGTGRRFRDDVQHKDAR